MDGDTVFGILFILWSLGKAIQIANRAINGDGAVTDAAKNGLVGIISRILK